MVIFLKCNFLVSYFVYIFLLVSSVVVCALKWAFSYKRNMNLPKPRRRPAWILSWTPLEHFQKLSNFYLVLPAWYFNNKYWTGGFVTFNFQYQLIGCESLKYILCFLYIDIEMSKYYIARKKIAGSINEYCLTHCSNAFYINF